MACIVSCGLDAMADENLGPPGAPLRTLAGKVVSASGMPSENATVRVRNTYAKIDVSTVAGDDGQFSIDLRCTERRLNQLKISATAADGKSIGYLRIPYSENEVRTESVQIELEPLKTAKVRVVDADGAPIESANVVAQLNYPIVLEPVATDANGWSELRLPESERISTLVAWKDGDGLDYRLYKLLRGQTGDRLAKPPEFPFEHHETLELTGSSPLTVRLTDATNAPIEGARPCVWLLRKQPGADSLNLSFFTEFFEETTGADGVGTFEWFPSWQKSKVVVWPNAEGYVRPQQIYDPTVDKGQLNATLPKLQPIRGKVVTPGGQPAQNIAVMAIGAGYSFERFQSGATTDENGNYEILAAPNHVYMLFIKDKQWSAPIRTGFAVLPGHALPDFDFQLRKATRVHGRVLDAETGEPAPDQLLYFQQSGTALHDMPDVTLPNPENSKLYVCPTRQQNMRSDSEGKFEFITGPGEHRLFVRGTDTVEFTIADETNYPIDLQVHITKGKVLTGLVLDAKTRKGIVGAKISSVSRNFRESDDWKAITVAEGKFQVDRKANPAVLHIVDAETKRGAITEIDAEQSTLVVKLRELGSATARLMVEGGTAPDPGVKLSYGVNIAATDGGLSTRRFGGVVTTNEQGEFTLSGLVPDHEYECTLFDHPSGYILKVLAVTVKEGESKELGDVETPPEPKPYVPPTIADRTASAFAVAGTPTERFNNAKKRVANFQQNLLVVFADPTGKLAESLMKIRYDSAEFRMYRDDFRFMAIPTDAERLAAAQELATELGMDKKLNADTLTLVVVNKDGKSVATIDEDTLTDGDGLVSSTRLVAELEEFKIEPLDGRKLLEDALARARREKKSVLVQETATWCGPCHRLSAMLTGNEVWKKDFIWVKMDHRWTEARDIMAELRDGASGGIPWTAILNADGDILATSNMSDTGENIGFPSSEKGRQHFANMLRSGARRMTDDEIVGLALGEQK